jgi:hypothetical protein
MGESGKKNFCQELAGFKGGNPVFMHPLEPNIANVS